MGNDYSSNHYGFTFDFDYSLGGMRRGWNPVSQAAQTNLENAKTVVRDFIISKSFDNVTKYHENYEPTKEEKKEFKLTTNKKIENIREVEMTVEIIKFHIVSKLRPRLNEYCKNLGCTMKWRQLSDSEKSQLSKYKNQKRTIWFGSLQFNKNTRNILYNKDETGFECFDYLAEACLFSTFKKMGIPACDAIGWIKTYPGNGNGNGNGNGTGNNNNNNNGVVSLQEQINNLPYAQDIVKYINEQCERNNSLKMTNIETLPEYQNEYSKYKLKEKYQSGKSQKKQSKLSLINDNSLNENKNVGNVTKNKRKKKNESKSNSSNEETPKSKNKDIRQLMMTGRQSNDTNSNNNNNNNNNSSSSNSIGETKTKSNSNSNSNSNSTRPQRKRSKVINYNEDSEDDVSDGDSDSDSDIESEYNENDYANDSGNAIDNNRNRNKKRNLDLNDSDNDDIDEYMPPSSRRRISRA